MNMKAKATEIIEAEVLDENGRPVETDIQTKPAEKETARAGVFAGFVALAFSFVMILLMAVVTVFIVFPFMLLGRLLGMQVKNLRR